ncbi:hypothetical protein PVAG01_04887 [Phlyctema vagabunda]|uniref:Uncharacterized protein n=1 Tax=Phlyctema vagabunda TaxID=108571 RepID=A0ABR4PIK8_9HELO
MRAENQHSYVEDADLRPITRTSRLLTPMIVCTVVAGLLVSSVTGVLIAAAILSSKPHAGYTGASQSFIAIASSISFLYIFLHCIAAVRNLPVGTSRPPKHKIHAFSFIFARLAIVAWIVSLIISIAVLSKQSTCENGGLVCRLEVVDVVICAIACIATGIILTALESCQHPFQGPRCFSGVKCRVSAFEHDINIRPISSSTSSSEEKSVEGDQIRWQNNVKRKPLAPPPFVTMMGGDLPSDYIIERPAVSPLLPPVRSKSLQKSWDEAWKHLAADTSEDDQPEKKPLSKSLSLNSVSSTGSSGRSSNSTLSDGTADSLSKRHGRPRTVTPSSSISNLSRRSPLSTMRSAEFPDIVIQPELYVPKIPPPHEWSSNRTEPMHQLLPILDLREVQRRPSSMHHRPSARVAPLTIRKHGGGGSRPGSLRRPPPMSILRRTTAEVKVPGAFTDCRLSRADEARVEDHASKIEAASLRSVARSESQRSTKPHAPVRLPAGEFEQRYAPSRVDSRTRYREQRPHWPGPVVNRHNTVSGLTQHPPDQAAGARPFRRDDHRGTKQLRRLTLGDLDVGLGKLWDA